MLIYKSEGGGCGVLSESTSEGGEGKRVWVKGETVWVTKQKYPGTKNAVKKWQADNENESLCIKGKKMGVQLKIETKGIHSPPLPSPPPEKKQLSPPKKKRKVYKMILSLSCLVTLG